MIFGGDLPSNDAATTALITNEEVLEVDQHSKGGREVQGQMDIRVWVASGAKPGEYYVAVFNLTDNIVIPRLEWLRLGISAPVKDVRDLWARTSVDTTKGFEVGLRPHDGLESVATYATTMTAVLFYLPATLLWVGTILFAVIVGYRVLQLGKRWLDAKSLPAAKQ